MSLENLEKAKRIKQEYEKRMEKIRWKSRGGDDEAARELMRLLAEQTGLISALGCRITDENEEGEPGRVVEKTEEWIKEQRAKMTELDLLQEKARNACLNNDPNKGEIVAEFIKASAKS